jgi:hypothetical protein
MRISEDEADIKPSLLEMIQVMYLASSATPGEGTWRLPHGRRHPRSPPPQLPPACPPPCAHLRSSMTVVIIVLSLMQVQREEGWLTLGDLGGLPNHKGSLTAHQGRASGTNGHKRRHLPNEVKSQCFHVTDLSWKFMECPDARSVHAPSGNIQDTRVDPPRMSSGPETGIRRE